MNIAHNNKYVFKTDEFEYKFTFDRNLSKYELRKITNYVRQKAGIETDSFPTPETTPTKEATNRLTGLPNLHHSIRKTLQKRRKQHEKFRDFIVCKDSLRNKKRTRLVLSSHRVLGVQIKKDTPVYEVALSQISEVEIRGGIIKELWLFTTNGTRKVWQVPPDTGPEFKDKIEDEMGKPIRRNKAEVDADQSLNVSRSELQSLMQNLDSYDFEYFVADLWEERGWDTEVSPRSGDAGVDIVATRGHQSEQKQVIQTKRYGPNTSVGGPEIQQYASLQLQFPDADEVLVVTTGSFTGAAEERAEELDVLLVDGRELTLLVEDHDFTAVLSSYLTDAQKQQG
ncbi:restriction endonuclease [Halorussus lipolyticus]|uniref:restriction endonuclease n=1 Tax=Halorussus lipolyticus TaxID=3034024 RepID=UPI0023E7F566|nr:restriction endonuclease [Halorussus sp. DT80]